MFLSFKKFLLSQKLKLAPDRGFSMLELIVVMAIFLIITAVVIADIPNFRQKSSLDLTANEVATYIRGAQVYGASQKSGGTGQVVYGIHLSSSPGENGAFYLFKDLKPSPGEKPEESYEINGFKISRIKVSQEDSDSDLAMVDLVFKSNNYANTLGTQLEPSLYADYSLGSSPSDFVLVEIKISPNNESTESRCVCVYSNGQITVESCNS